MTATHRVILDTDIGTDVDDILALAVLLGSPEIDLIGVTTVYGDVQLRARMVLKLLQLRERGDVPVHTGIARPLLGLEPIYWPGHEGVGLLEEGDTLPPVADEHAVDFLIRQVTANPEEVTLLAVGPLTNVAMALVREPHLATQLKRLVIMGGMIETSRHPGRLSEHNIACDPEAAYIVLSSGAPIELVPLDVTLRAVIRQDGVEALERAGTPYHAALADQVVRLPQFAARGGNTFLHDPLAALAIFEPGLLTWDALNVQVELAGRLTRGMTVGRLPGPEFPVTARVALDLDVDACEARIAARLLA